MNEFELIAHYFAERKQSVRDDVILGIGDDCAILEVPSDQQLLISIDTLVNGVHFPENTDPFDIGYKALAVNLSDLAAMGARPAWFSLALTLPQLDQKWLQAFTKGLFHLAEEFQVQLVGGDTTRGPLALTIQVHGFVAKGKAVTRRGAQVGDLIYVTNNLGDAGLALQHIQGQIELTTDAIPLVTKHLNRPYPRVKEGLLLADYATTMIDLSDGLIADLDHILKQSKVGALINLAQLPLSSELKQALPHLEAVKLALSAGDDYELCFTIPENKRDEVERVMQAAQAKIHCIGVITAGEQLLLQENGQLLSKENLHGFSHF